MTDRQLLCSTSTKAEPGTIVQRIRRWWRSGDRAEQYLAAATDLADLERRMRELERASGGPVIVTFNH
jgi:Protein of unknown function (DUF3563)